MAKTIFIAGKEMPAGTKFADGISMSGRSISITGPDVEKNDEEDDTDRVRQISEAAGISVIEWHKSSPISARTAILKTETIFGKMDEAVLYFDEEWFASQEMQLSTNECMRVLDELVMPFQTMALEILSRFEKKNSSGTPGRLVFLLKETPDMFEVAQMPSLKNGSAPIASPAVSAAAASFTAFAENIAVQYGAKPYVDIFLFRGDIGNETSSGDVSLGQWVCTYLDSFQESGLKQEPKTCMNWIKAGTRYAMTSGFSALFGKNKKGKK